MPNPHALYVRITCCVLWCLSWPIIAVMLLRPLPFLLPSRSDLLGHFLLFGVMSVFVIFFARSRKQIIWLSIVTVGLSVALEIAQGFVPHRIFDVADALANMAGGISGCFLALLIFRNLDVSIKTSSVDLGD